MDFVGEGNCNVVFRFNTEKVIKFPKLLKNLKYEFLKYFKILYEIKFFNNYVISQYLPYVSPFKIINVNIKTNDLQYPLLRINKSLPKNLIYGIQQNSFLYLNNFKASFSFEIKPKAAPFDDEHCTFHFKQFIKETFGFYSSYCPYLLYSSNIQNIQKAILLLSNNPQNNFRYFINGVESVNFNKFHLNILSLIWYKENEAIKHLKKLQQSNKYHINVIYKKYKTLQKIFPHIYKWSFLKLWHYCKAKNFITSKFSSETYNNLLCLKNFLISLSAKDCSVMIVFHISPTTFDNKNNKKFIRHDNEYIYYKIGLIDLAPKPVIKVEETYKKYINMSKFADISTIKQYCFNK